MCEICVDHLKLFPHEYKLYTREQLARHRREGDPGDPAYKGHPLCQFCEERFLDTETLFFHLKNKHFWCHICEVDGSQDYYASYAELRTHFRQSHYLCSEGPCRYEKFTTVFRTKLDFQVRIIIIDKIILFDARDICSIFISPKKYSFSLLLICIATNTTHCVCVYMCRHTKQRSIVRD